MWSVLSSILASLLSSVLGAMRQRRLDKERTEHLEQAAILEAENEALRKIIDAKADAGRVNRPTAGDVSKRLHDGTF